ncbi:hypothetical protein QAD02_024340 [Eretmocerus hayati]|uniref:Uncharacterized protein n=1 Tax=Eretmocerus hayati TaxID=131215 RepID=A0ACC2Q3B2_9HYME|nr:hypothetical protein QAD02_024340 [Eretmocerus hayati]
MMQRRLLLLLVWMGLELVLVYRVQANPDAKRLYDDLLSNYNRLIRPVLNNNDTVVVKLGLRLSQLIELNLKDQILTTNVWLEHEWQDHKFKWDPSEYGGMTELYVPSEHIWLPDIVLYNNADGEYGVTTMTKAILHWDGKVTWTPPAIFKSSCQIDVRYFPFDQQTCFMKFGSWTYDGFQIDLKHINSQEGQSHVSIGIDLREYYPSVEWDILSVPAERHEKYYSCCHEPYIDIFFNITLRRKTLFYTVNLIIPCVSISYLSVLAFYLPADSGEKIALCINILLSQTMFFLLISEIIPSTSLALPLLGKYLLFTMILVALSVVVTIVILNIHYRKPSTHKMAPWVREVFIRRMPRWLWMRVPEDLLEDLAAHKIYGRRILQPRPSLLSSSSSNGGKPQSKFSAAVAAAVQQQQSSSLLSSPESLRGCNGLQHHHHHHLHHTTMAHNRFAIGGVPAYNGGLPQAMACNGAAGLDNDDSISDNGAVRKKYPFELEKALHNVMFIQHHITRQDEFNAEDQDWGFVAMVLDRLFLWVFAIASLLGTILILCEAPSLYDDTKPIDMELSSVARQMLMPNHHLDKLLPRH